MGDLLNYIVAPGCDYLYMHFSWKLPCQKPLTHYNAVIMNTVSSQITSLTIVYPNFYSGADQRKHQNSASLAFVRGNYQEPVNSPHKVPVTWKMFPLDDVIMQCFFFLFVCAMTYKPSRAWQNWYKLCYFQLCIVSSRHYNINPKITLYIDQYPRMPQSSA